jgi:hypothetical protein
MSEHSKEVAAIKITDGQLQVSNGKTWETISKPTPQMVILMARIESTARVEVRANPSKYFVTPF